MLRPEQAQEALKQFRIEDWTERRLAALAKLPKRLAEVGRALLARDDQGKPLQDWEVKNTRRTAAVEQLDQMTTRERGKVFEALFPKIAGPIEAGWQLTCRLPYQHDYARKGFRAPQTPEASRDARSSWIEGLVERLSGYDPDITWLASWAAHLSEAYRADVIGLLLAAAIDAGGTEGEAVFDILCDSARGEHAIGAMGRHVSRALLVCSRPEGWEFIEKMLLAAQRQEGLRQVILESIDEAHPEAFRRMLRLIQEHDLARFSATVRAINVWFGFMWDSVSVRVVNDVIAQVLQLLEDGEARAKALAGATGNGLYLALWATAFEDAVAAVKPAVPLLTDPDVERRFVAVTFLAQLRLPAAEAALQKVLDDEDLRVALTALAGCRKEEGALFKRIEQLLPRVPAKKTLLPALVWPWATVTADRQRVASELARHLGDLPPTRLIPYLPSMDGYGRGHIIGLLAGQKKWDSATRDTLFAMVGDTNSWTRTRAVEALAKCKVSVEEAGRLEGYLTRKAGDLRRAVLSLLLNQKDEAALASADRLLAVPDKLQRLAGLELLRQLAEGKRLPEDCRARAEAYRSGRPRLDEEEQSQLTAILDADRQVYTLEDALGLMNPAERTRPVPPKKHKVAFLTPATLACLQALDDLIHEHRETPITIETWEGSKQELLGNVRAWGFPSPKMDVPPEEDAARFPLREVWESWLAERPKKQRDKDGLELVRARAWFGTDEESWEELQEGWADARDALHVFTGGLKPVKLRHGELIGEVLEWLLRLHPPAGAVDFLLDAVETSFALVPPEDVSRVIDPSDWQERDRDSRASSPFVAWLGGARAYCTLCPSAWNGTQHTRLWRLLRWEDEPTSGVYRDRPELAETLAAYCAGGATEADLLDQLLGPRSASYFGGGFEELTQLTQRKPAPELDRYPRLRELLDQCRARILEIELDRGTLPTAASPPARELRSLYGIDTLVRLLKALGGEKFNRGRQTRHSKPDVLSYLSEITYPAESDTPERFAACMKAAGFPTERLTELAFHAPQWVRHVEHALGWPQFAEGVWWFIAHTRYGNTGGDHEAWKALVSERTPLTNDELHEGAVDVAWFERVYAAVGPKRWQQLYDAAKYACTGTGHKQAQFLTDVLLGRAKKTELVGNIRQKHSREAVRLLGLLPLAKAKARDGDLLGRYHVFQEYLRYARQLGSMSRDGALRTAAIGMANLARTAGYPDPVRLEWAMEAESLGDLAKGPVSVSVNTVKVTLNIDDQGQPELTVARDGKPLKAVPAPVKKNAKVAELVARKTELKRQASRMRLSLEQAMCRGDAFTGEELRRLFAHPVLAPLLERLVLVGDGILGYPVAGGQALCDHAGKKEPIKKNESLRLAHPHDLLQSKDWHLWQHDCFAREQVQPFKQVFRELYVLTEAEKADGTLSRRYAGQQVNPKQASALWGSRGWVVSPDEGVRRTFHDAGLSAWVTFLGGVFTPAEVEGLTIEGVRFSKRGEWKPLPLTEIPPRLFSEVMRDLDLVVSVAHRGGVDPEASASTVEMRASLLRETCTLLKVSNVRLKGTHALIDGQLSNYTVHLGSAVVHRQPGGALCLVPVHAQHRGRLFLPFADDDPKTAEVLAKVLLLARDAEIQDPGILDQIRAGR